MRSACRIYVFSEIYFRRYMRCIYLRELKEVPKHSQAGPAAFGKQLLEDCQWNFLVEAGARVTGISTLFTPQLRSRSPYALRPLGSCTVSYFQRPSTRHLASVTRTFEMSS